MLNKELTAHYLSLDQSRKGGKKKGEGIELVIEKKKKNPPALRCIRRSRMESSLRERVNKRPISDVQRRT